MNVSFTLKQLWKYDFLTSAWALESGANPCSITAGNALIGFQTGWHNAGDIPIPTDSAGTFADFANGKTVAAPLSAHIFVQRNAAGGNHTITPYGSMVATNDDGLIWIYEYTGPSLALEQTSGNARHVASAATAWEMYSANGKPQVGDLALALTYYENSVALPTTNLTNPPGWIQLDVRQAADINLPTQLCYKILTNEGTISANWSATADAHITDNGSVIVSCSSGIVVQQPIASLFPLLMAA